MKKKLSLILAMFTVLALASLTACSGNNSPSYESGNDPQNGTQSSVGESSDVKSNMVYTLCKHMVYMLSITNEHKNELEMRAKPEWKVHFLCFASAKRGSFSIR